MLTSSNGAPILIQPKRQGSRESIEAVWRHTRTRFRDSSRSFVGKRSPACRPQKADLERERFVLAEFARGS